MKTIFSQRLKEARKRCGFSQEKLAQSLDGVSTPTVHRWEVGAREPSFKVLKDLATLLGVTCDWLLGESEELRSLRPVVPMAFWGSVVDNARFVVENGNEDDRKDALTMVNLAINILNK